MTSSKLGPVYDAQDDFDAETYETLEDLKSALADIASTAEEVAGEYEEALGNMPEGTDSSPVAEAMQEKIDYLQSYAQELEGFDPDVEEFDEDQAREEAEEEIASAMISEMDLDEVREHLLIDVDETPELDDDGEAEDPLEGMDEKDIVVQHGDEAEYTSRVDATIERMREQFTEDHGDVLDDARAEATELVAGLEL
jgi:hypothetical protein